jgi:hypothetical protein
MIDTGTGMHCIGIWSDFKQSIITGGTATGTVPYRFHLSIVNHM